MVTTVAPQRRPGRGLVHPAAASSLSPSWLHGPPAPARVVAVFDRAAYLLREADQAVPGEGLGEARETHETQDHAEVLPLLAPGALDLPGGLRVISQDHLEDLGLVVGDQVRVGRGQVHAPGSDLVVRRTWRPRAVPSRVLPAAARDTARAAAQACLALVHDRLPAELPMHGGARAWSRPAELVGLGPGLTPAGDDLLCGVLLGLRASGREDERAVLERSVTALLDRTTALSATLLRQAARGYAVPPVLDLLHAWHRHADPARLVELGSHVAAVGHSSGPALLLGLAASLTDDHPPTITQPAATAGGEDPRD